ncbi:MAG: hypothetical protein V4503_11020 [Gemmatimonadota bacterium]
MAPRIAMRSRAVALVALLLPAVAAPMAAQRTHDESRLVIGVAGGWIGGKDLWAVQQPVNASAPRQDVFDIHRALRSNITLAGQGTYFPSPHIGITAEATYLGIGTRDQCALVDPTGDFVNEAACRSINGNDRSASGVALMGGVMLRPLSRSLFQPYFRALGGLSLVPRSTVELVAVYGTASEGALPIYFASKSHEVRPTGTLGFGIATAPRAGYQVRVEVRNTWIGLPVITGPNPSEAMVGRTKSKYIALPSITLGFDVVLEKRRGRRY